MQRGERRSRTRPSTTLRDLPVRRPRVREARSPPRAPHRHAGGDLRRGQDARADRGDRRASRRARTERRWSRASMRRSARRARARSHPGVRLPSRRARSRSRRGDARSTSTGKGTILVVSAGTVGSVRSRRRPRGRRSSPATASSGSTTSASPAFIACSTTASGSRAARVLIVVAGMEGALPSVVGGLVDEPVIAVPTSVGYGASFGGLAALLAHAEQLRRRRHRREHRQRLRRRRRGEPHQSSLRCARQRSGSRH